MPESSEEPIEFEITDELDLHTFRPSEVGELVPDYIELAQDKGFFRVRIIHGKGIGTLRDRVHAILRKNPCVEHFELAGQGEGAWGATIAWLRRGDDE
ncbi:MAG: Smr/MutS family protein [Opitutales bacterium]